MSVNCNISVQFEVANHAKFNDTVEEHVRRCWETDDFDGDARRMLHYAEEGGGVAGGPKGDMFSWATVGNYSSVSHFVEALHPFWASLYENGAVSPGDGIVVMFQQEQVPSVQIVEISLDRTSPRDQKVLVVREGVTPFPLFGWYFERPDALLPSNVTVQEVEGETPLTTKVENHVPTRED